MEEKNIIFRVDASVEIGSGHVMRCLTLADELKKRNHKSTFICRNFLGNMGSYIQKRGYSTVLLDDLSSDYSPSEGDSRHAKWLGAAWEVDVNDVLSALDGNVDYLVVDHYGIDSRWHQKLRSVAKKIIVIDDLADRSLDCDLLINQTYGCDVSQYDSLIGKQCWSVLGAMYALISPDFLELRSEAFKRRVKKNKVSNILVFMGGMDADNLTEKVLESLSAVELEHDVVVNVILGANSPHYEKIRKRIVDFSFKTRLLSGVSNMASLMLQADLAIGSGGSTTWERCCLGLPTLLVTGAENQKYVVKNLSNNESIVDLGLPFELGVGHISDQISTCLLDDDKRSQMSLSSFMVCDGRGVFRVAQYIEALKNQSDHVYLRPVQFSDAKTMYQWQSKKSIRRYSRNPKLPTWNEHISWLSIKMQEVSCIFNLIMFNNEPAGIVRLDEREGKEHSYEVSILISPSMQGNGIAFVSLNLARNLVPNSTIIADVSPENIASQSLFKKLGYAKVDDRTYVLH